MLIILLLILIGCGKVEKEGDRTLRLGGLGGKPASLNPILTNQTISMALVELLFNKLVRINSRMLPEPDLAERWEVSSDGLVYTFYLRQGVRFHDGVEFTAQDCEFTYNAVLDPANDSPWRDTYNIIKECQVQDRYIFTVTLKEPKASFINLMLFTILPKHLLAGLKGQQLRDSGFNHQPIGTGPFRFKEWVTTPQPPLLRGSEVNSPLTKGDKGGCNESIILEANPDYYEGKPPLNRIEATGYDTFPQYFSAFMKQQTDMILFLNKEQFETVKRDHGFKTYQTPSVHTYAIDYNLEHPLFNDKKIRQAIAHAIDIQGIINKVESGYGVQSTGPFMPGSWNYNPEVKPLEYNPALALKLLKEAGWEMGDDGILQSPLAKGDKGGCRQFRFVMLIDIKERNIETIAKVIYQELYKVGIRMEIKPFDSNKSKDAQDNRLMQDAGACLTTFQLPNELEPFWHSREQAESGKLWTYLNPELDQLFESANLATDIAKRKEIYHRLHRIIYDDQPAAFLYFLSNLCAINNKFSNADGLFSPTMPFYTIKDWKVSTKEQ